jgi:superfamily II DNA helicase RecQ
LPPYVIFHDATLIEVAHRRSISLTSLATIPGIGASKLERYGGAIIEIVSQKVLEPGTVRAALPSGKPPGRTKGPG